MVQDPGFGYHISAKVIGVQGNCSAGHKVGEQFDISCINSGGLCGFFYHDMFPDLQTFQFGGSLPWWEGDVLEVNCPDPVNLVALRLERSGDYKK